MRNSMLIVILVLSLNAFYAGAADIIIVGDDSYPPYSYKDQDKRKKKIFVVRPYPETKQDKEYIDYIKKIFKKSEIDFDYLNLNIK